MIYSHVIPIESSMSPRRICGNSEGDSLPGTYFHLVSPSSSRSPSASPARTTVFSSCCKTPDLPQKCQRQRCPRQSNGLFGNLISGRAYAIANLYQECYLPQTLLNFFLLKATYVHPNLKFSVGM